jgi:hypothetical protein
LAPLEVKFSSSSIYGAFMFFFNGPYSNMTSSYHILSNSFAIDDIKTDIKWTLFEKQIAENLKLNEHDDVLGNQLKEALNSTFVMQMSSGTMVADFKRLLEANDAIALSHLVQKFIQTKMGFQNMHISVDFDQTTSLDMELNSISSKKIDPHEFEKSKQVSEKSQASESEEESEDDALKGKEIKLILTGALILSPIKGKDISQVVVGDRVKISIIDDNPKAISLAKAFKAYEDGNIKPITGRVISIRHQSAGGYKIFVIVAKGIYIIIDEEEENIKVALDPAHNFATKPEQEKTSKANIPMIIVLTLFLLGLITAIYFFIR